MKRDRIYLSHILEAIEKIERYLGDTDYETFVANDMMIDAIIREPDRCIHRRARRDPVASH